MIEISDKRGEKVLINKESIKNVKENFDERYPSIRCVVNLLDGNIINSCMSYDAVKILILGDVGVSVNDYQTLMDFCNSVAWAGERWKLSSEIEMISRARKILSTLDKSN